jgi:two-component system response regulator DevR
VIRVFLLDDHEVVRDGVRAGLGAQPDIEVVGEWGTASEALDEVSRCQPDVAVIDVRLGDGNGIDICREISSQHPAVQTLILTSFESDRALIDASLAGAAGFVLKQIRSTELIDAIRLVAEGRQLLDDAEVRQATRRLARSEAGRLDQLTAKERRIFDLIGEGKTNRQIAEQMFLAEKTIKNYVSNLLAKLGMARRTEAAALAARIDEREHPNS